MAQLRARISTHHDTVGVTTPERRTTMKATIEDHQNEIHQLVLHMLGKAKRRRVARELGLWDEPAVAAESDGYSEDEQCDLLVSAWRDWESDAADN
jgi:hypothetical protein